MSSTPSTDTTLNHSRSLFASLSTFAERQQEHFPLNTFFSLQTFRLYHSAVEVVGGFLEYPLSILQL